MLILDTGAAGAAAIPLSALRPFMLRPLLLDADLNDPLDLRTQLTTRLRESSEGAARGEPGAGKLLFPGIYLEDDQLQGVYQPRGSYRVQRKQVTVTLALWRDKERVAGRREVTAGTAQITGRLLMTIEELLRGLK